MLRTIELQYITVGEKFKVFTPEECSQHSVEVSYYIVLPLT